MHGRRCVVKEGRGSAQPPRRLNHNRLMLARMMAFVVWGLLACSGVYWLVQLLDKPLPSQAQPVSEQSLAAADLSRLFGAAAVAAPQAAEPAVESRLKLLGLVAPKSAAPH